MPALLYVLISGSASTYTVGPRPRKWSLIGNAPTRSAELVAAAQERLGRRLPRDEGARDHLLGQAIGEDELPQEIRVHGHGDHMEPVELKEIDRKDFDRILKADRTSERGRLIEFLTSLSMFEGISVAATHALSNIVTRKTHMRNQLCLAHPADPTLGSASYHNDYVYLIFSRGETLCGADPNDKRLLPPIDVGADRTAWGPLADTSSPPSSKVERHRRGGRLRPTLGPAECITDNLPSLERPLVPQASHRARCSSYRGA